MPPEPVPPDVSVLMAVYDAEAYVESAVRSVLNQTYRNFERFNAVAPPQARHTRHLQIRHGSLR